MINLQNITDIVYNTVTGQTVYSYPYQFLEKEDLQVIKIDSNGIETILNLSVDYTIQDKPDYRTGANITLNSSIPTGNKLAISLNVDIEQTNQYPNAQTFPAKATETALDKITLTLMQLRQAINRSVKVAIDAIGLDIKFPSPVVDRFLIWENSSGKLKNSSYSTDSFLTTIQSSATSASNSASSASTSANTATTQATSASNSASSASTSATLAGNYANYSEDSLVPGGSGYSALHWRNKAEDQYLLAAGLIEAIDDLTSGVYLAWESRTANFTAVYGGRYFANTTSGGITVTLPSSPSVLTEVEIFTNATDDNPLTISNSPIAVSGYETNPLIITRVGFLKLKYDPVLTKWVWLNYSEAPKRFREVATNLTAGSANEVRPGDYIYVDSTSGARSIDAPYGTSWPKIGDEFTIVDDKGTFAINNCTIVFNPKKVEGVAQNVVLSQNGAFLTYRYINDTTGWKYVR